MKLSKRDLRRLIESVINEDAASSAAKGAKAGLLSGGGLAAYLGSLAAGVGGEGALTVALSNLSGLGAMEVLSGTGTAAQGVISGMGYAFEAQTVETLIAGVSASAAAVGLAGFAGYALGDYINDIMTGNTGTEEEKFLNSFKKSAKLTIGELGTSIFGFELDWDTMDDGEYMTAAAKKKYKGLNPRDIDKDRLKQLTTAIVGHRNFSESGKLPKGLADLFDFGYLNAETFKPFIEKAEKKKLDKMMAKLKEAGTKKKEATNESLSRGSQYRRRDLRRLIESVINEDDYEQESDIRMKSTQTEKGSETKRTVATQGKNIQTGQKIDTKHVSGKFANGVVYGSSDYKDSATGHHGKILYVGKMNKSDKAKTLGISITSKPGQRPKLGFRVEGQSANAVKFLAKLAILGVRPKDIVKAVKEMSTEIDVSELEKEIKESLSRGSLYRRRYHGRY